jgi:3-hydroxyisobutyrate dehydrogenase
MDALGFVGLGSMGGAIAARIASTGQQVIGTDLNAGARQRAAQRGISVENNGLPAICAHTGVVMLSLPRADHVRQVVEGPDGILAHARPGTLVIDATTSDPQTSRELARKLEAAGHVFLDAPVSGLPLAADAGTLAIMVGGPAEALERARPYLERVAGTIIHVGPSGAGNVAKIVNNLLSSTHTLIAAEAALLAESSGVSAEAMMQVLNASSGRSWATEVLYPRFVLTGGYDAGFAVELMRKDVRLGLDLMRDTGAATPVISRAAGIWDASESYLPDDADLTRMTEAVTAQRTGEH